MKKLYKKDILKEKETAQSNMYFKKSDPFEKIKQLNW